MEDEYYRDYSFDPEFIWRKDSHDVSLRQHNSIKHQSRSLIKSSSDDEDIHEVDKRRKVDNEVEAFRTVNDDNVTLVCASVCV